MTREDIFTGSHAPGALPLPGAEAEFFGLERSSLPQLADSARRMFARLAALLAFPGTEEGRRHQTAFALLARNCYPEILVDIADRVHVQHERPAVILNFDHINANLERDPQARSAGPPASLNPTMSFLFEALAHRIENDPALRDDPELVRALGEGYAHYLYATRNFPWEEQIDPALAGSNEAILDAATGLAGFSLIAEWPKRFFPPLVLADAMPFVETGLRCFLELERNPNVEVVRMEFPRRAECERRFGAIWANKFLHHLQRPERQEFLAWAFAHLNDGGSLIVVDTDLELRILRDAQRPEYRAKLNPAYLKTLVEVEDEFCKNVTEDLVTAGFEVRGFDFREYMDETDAYSLLPGDAVTIRFNGLEAAAVKKIRPEESRIADS